MQFVVQGWPIECFGLRPFAGAHLVATFMSVLGFQFLEQALAGNLAAKLAARPPADGGCRRLRNVVYRASGLRMPKLPKWLAPTVSAVALVALTVAVQRRRVR